ncbi:hypothetical protein MXB_479, partial [Myxobolus squamalis]
MFFSFFIFNTLKTKYKISHPQNPNPSISRRFIYGAIGGIVSIMASYPFDVVKHNYQSDGADTNTFKYKKLAPTFLYMYKTRGPLK